MKAHKYWGMGALVCMALCVCSGSDKELIKAHKYFAIGAAGCTAMALYSGYKMKSGGCKKAAEIAQE